MRIPLLFASLMLLPAVLPAQIRTESSPKQTAVFFGASFNGSNPASNFSTGISGGGDFRLAGPLGGEAQVSWFSHGNGTNTITVVDYLAGPRVQTGLSNRVAPFADLLLGGQTLHNSSSQHSYYYTNGLGLALSSDVGADFRVTRRIAIRGQFGFLFSEFAVTGGGGPIGNYRWRGGANLVYRF